MPPKTRPEEIPAWLESFLKRQEANREKAHQEQLRILQEILNSRSNEPVPIHQASTSATNIQRSEKNTSAPRPPLLQEDTNYSKFLSWRETWQDYSMLIKLENLEEDVQRAHLRSCINEEMRSYIKCALGISKDTTMSVKEILDNVEQHLRQRRNIAIDRAAFEERRQQEGESFDNFYVSLKKLSAEADLCGQCLEPRLVTRIMTGIRCKELKQKLLAISPFPELKEVVNTCRSYESSIRDCTSLDDPKLNKISNYQKQKKQNSDRKTETFKPNKSKKNDQCYYCGRERHQSRNECPARASTCRNCNKVGHWDCVCLAPKKNNDQKVKFTAQDEDDYIHNLSVNQINLKTPRVTAKFTFKNNSTSSSSIPDTGAEVNVAGENLMKALNIKTSDLNCKNNSNLRCANDSRMKVIGSAQVKIKINNIETTEKIIFCNNQKEILLSWHTCKKLAIISDNFPTQIRRNEIEEKSIRENTKKKLLEEYQDVFDTNNHLKKMSGEPMKIHLKEDSSPFAIYSARNIPHAWREEVRQNLKEMEQSGIIAPLKDEPSDWCHPMVVVQKPKGGVRICVDLTQLNKQIQRPVYPTKTPHEATSNIKPNSKYFTAVDAKHGYWQIPLEEKSQHLTTFLTPWGRYKFLRAPMGLSSTGDEYCRRHNSAIGEHLNMQKVMDDVLLYDETFESHEKNVRKFLESCRKNGITLHPDKFQFAEEEISYVGYTVSKDGVSVDKHKIDAISSFPRPQNLTDLKSFFGLINQLSSFSKEISKLSSPLRELLKKDVKFTWLPAHDEAFDAVKHALCKPPILAYFDPRRETILETDASKNYGLGYALLQKHEDQWKLVQCGSRYLSETESRYAIIELELQAVVWAMNKCKLYLLGMRNFQLNVDHRPLVSILDKKNLGEIENPRLQRMKEKILKFNFKTNWISGTKHQIPDALSRAPVASYSKEEKKSEEYLEVSVNAILQENMANFNNDGDNSKEEDILIKNLSKVAAEDQEYNQLLKEVQKGFPKDKSKLINSAKPYWNIRNDLSIDQANDLIIYNGRIVVPKLARKEILKKLHSSHQGIDRTKRRARQILYWPCMNSDIANLVSSCEKCHSLLPSQQKEPLKQDPLPSRVFEEVAIDFFSCSGRNYLIYTDRLSGWPVVYQFGNGETTSKNVITACLRCFTDLGVPVILRSDCGSQFTSSEFQKFLTDWGVTHKKSTPYYHQSNGIAEAAVKSIKKIILTSTQDGNLETESFRKALLEWRNTPRDGGLSPAQILFGHPLRSFIPAHKSSFHKKWRPTKEDHRQKRSTINEKVKEAYDARSKSLTEFKRGDQVWIQNPLSKRWVSQGVITRCGANRDYLIKTSNGKSYWRNRRFIRR